LYIHIVAGPGESLSRRHPPYQPMRDRQMTNAIQVTDLLRQGIAAAQAGRTQEARQALLRVTEMDEWNEQAWLWLSGVVDSIEDQHICLENALAINPHNPYAQAGLRWLAQQIPQQPTTQEQEHCPHCQAPVPPSGRGCPHCGQILIVACPACGQYLDVRESSCPECGQALGDFRRGAPYHLALAQAYLEHQRHTFAQEAAAHAAAQAPDDPQILEKVAVLYEGGGNVGMAIATYKRVLEHDTANAAICLRLGRIYRRRAMFAEARTILERAAAQDGNDPAILYELAQLYAGQDGTSPHTLKLLEQVVRLDPEHVQAHLRLGDAYLAQEARPQAVQHYERACELAQPDTRIGREARIKLGKLRPSLPQRQAQGWGETLRGMAGLLLTPALAALVNARLVPWEISLAAWSALLLAGAGAYLWVCATDVPRNPTMRAIFGQAGVSGHSRQALVGAPGALLWIAGLGLILSRA
jgi:tetratricopeptide (TPR) repeat protein